MYEKIESALVKRKTINQTIKQNIMIRTVMVSASAMIWHGWLKSVRPFTTGTEPYLARSSTSS